MSSSSANPKKSQKRACRLRRASVCLLGTFTALGLDLVALGAFAAQDPSSASPPSRPASLAGVPAPLVPLHPARLEPPARLIGSLQPSRNQQEGGEPGVTPAPGQQPAPINLSRPDPAAGEPTAGGLELDFRELGSQQESGEEKRAASKRTIETSGRVEVVKQHYPDGKVQIEREVTQDLEGNYFNHGYWRLFGPSGQTLADGVFQHGLMEGPWSRWHPAQPEGLFKLRPFNLFRGPFLSTATFVGGKLDGVWQITDSSQRKIMEVAYRNGKRHGLSAWYYPDSSRMREQYFNDGMLDGTLTEWDERGRETRRDEYVKGRRVVTETANYRPQQKKSEITYLDPLTELAGPDDWWEATPAAFKSIGRKVEHGSCGTWYENGQPQMQGQYDNGKRFGNWTWWHANGMKQLSGRFEADKKVGQWIWWHANGQKAIEGNYQADQAAGVWNWWDEKGRKTDSRNYELQSNERRDIEAELLELDNELREEQPAQPTPPAESPKPENDGTSQPASPTELKPGETSLPTAEEMEEIPLELPADPKKDG
jgi:antitoxin component YwqK of YwqJK toxin-antitoxin module